MNNAVNPFIEIERATVYRGDTRIFSQLSLVIDEGPPAAIPGPNGAGKSTFPNIPTR